MDSQRQTLEIDPAMVEVIARRCTEVETGARNIDHIIRERLLPMMSSALLERMTEGPLPPSVRIGVGDNEDFTVEFGATPAGRA